MLSDLWYIWIYVYLMFMISPFLYHDLHASVYTPEYSCFFSSSLQFSRFTRGSSHFKCDFAAVQTKRTHSGFPKETKVEGGFSCSEMNKEKKKNICASSIQRETTPTSASLLAVIIFSPLCDLLLCMQGRKEGELSRRAHVVFFF